MSVSYTPDSQHPFHRNCPFQADQRYISPLMISFHAPIDWPQLQPPSLMMFSASTFHPNRNFTYEVSGLYAYATTPNRQLPQNPYTHVFSHPSSLYFSPGGTPKSHPDGGSKWLSWDAVSGEGCSLTSGGCVEAFVRFCCWRMYIGPRRRVEFWRD